MRTEPRIVTDVVIPTVGHGSLALLLASLDGPPDRLPHRVIVVDDRSDPVDPLPYGALSSELRDRLDVFASGGRGAAAARNRGWHASRAEWIAFLDDDVIPCRGWLTELRTDLGALPADVAASQGVVRGPLADDAGAPEDWSDANVAYRRSALLRIGGFDELAPPRYAADADLSRIRQAGLRIVGGRRTVMHPTWAPRSVGSERRDVRPLLAIAAGIAAVAVGVGMAGPWIGAACVVAAAAGFGAIRRWGVASTMPRDVSASQVARAAVPFTTLIERATDADDHRRPMRREHASAAGD